MLIKWRNKKKLDLVPFLICTVLFVVFVKSSLEKDHATNKLWLWILFTRSQINGTQILSFSCGGIELFLNYGQNTANLVYYKQLYLNINFFYCQWSAG